MFRAKKIIIKINEFVCKTAFLIKHREIARPCLLRNVQYIHIHPKVRIKKGARIECYDCFGGERYSPSLVINDNVIIGYRFSCLVADEIIIDRNTILASDILITSENHGMNPESQLPYHEQMLSTAAVKIGKNCWIGEKVVILPGVTIGDYCIIAAGTIVNKSIPPYSIAAGNPVRIIKKYDFDSHVWVRITK